MHTFSLRERDNITGLDSTTKLVITNVSSHQTAVLSFSHEELSDLSAAIDTYLADDC